MAGIETKGNEEQPGRDRRTDQLVLPSGLTQYEHVTTANGIYSASDKTVHFGLGKENKIGKLEIRWPSGKVQTISELAINRVHAIAERE